MSMKDIYVLSMVVNFPSSFLITFASHNLHSLSFFPLVYITGFVQWVLIVGSLLDTFIPNIRFSLSIDFLRRAVKYMFMASIFGLLLSAAIIPNGYMSSIVYNVSLAIAVSSIGLKVLFLDEGDGKQ